MSVDVFVLRRVLLAPVRCVFVFGVFVAMGVDGAVAMMVFVLVLHVLVGVGVSDSPGVQMLVSVGVGCHFICIQ